MTPRVHVSRWSPVLVSSLCAVVLLFGLGRVVQQALVVAPWAAEAEVGRLHPHLRNVVRIAGGPRTVGDAVQRAVLADGPDADGDPLRIDLAAPHLVVVPEDPEDLAWALPGTYWAAWSGVPLLRLPRDELPPVAEAQVLAHGRPVLVLAPEAAISDGLLRRLAALAPTRRVAGGTPAEHAVRVAELRDPATGCCWGRVRGGGEAGAYVLVAASEAETGLAGVPLARVAGAALLLTGDDGGLPVATERHLWSRGDVGGRAFVLGTRTSYAAQARADLALEAVPWAGAGPLALGPLDALAVAWLALGLAGGVGVLAHAVRVRRALPVATRLGWAWAAALLPGLGIALYRRAGRPGGPRPVERTVLAFGQAAPVMVATAWAFSWYGLPLALPEGVGAWGALVGSGLPTMALVTGGAALGLAAPLTAASVDRAGRRGAPVRTAVVVAGVLLGGVVVGATRLGAGAPALPREDEVLWFGCAWAACGLGFALAWLLTAPLPARRVVTP